MKVCARLLMLVVALLLACGALAQDSRFVIRYRLQPSYWNIVLLPGEAREGMMQRVVRPGVDLVDWTAFKSDPQRYLAPLVVKNEYPASNVPKVVVALLEEYSGLPIGVTWTGGIAWSNDDRKHAETIYQLYRANPQEYERTKVSADKLLDPVHPEHRQAIEMARKAQAPWWACERDEQPKSRTPDQQRRLENFGRDRFSLKAPGASRGAAVFSRSDLIRRFGSPISTSSKKAFLDPQDIRDRTLVIVTTWNYPGFTIVTEAVESTPDRLSISEGEVSDARVSLGGVGVGVGVGVGQSIEQWERQFGRPQCTGQYGLQYEWQDGDGLYWMDVYADAAGKVVRVAWRPGSMH